MVLAGVALYGLTASPVFAYRHLVVDDAALTERAAIAASVGVDDGANLFELATGPIGQRLVQLPSVAGVDVSVRLPDTVAIHVHERVPILVWAIGPSRFLVDDGGMLFASLPDPAGSLAALPIVDDKRAESAGLGIGQHLDGIDLDAATRLGALQPARDLGSTASALSFTVDNASGYVVAAQPGGWQAVFGFYTPTLRKTDLIPGQIRLLASLLAKAGEPNVSTVILATDTDGTYVPRSSARAGSTPKP